MPTVKKDPKWTHIGAFTRGNTNKLQKMGEGRSMAASNLFLLVSSPLSEARLLANSPWNPQLHMRLLLQESSVDNLMDFVDVFKRMRSTPWNWLHIKNYLNKIVQWTHNFLPIRLRLIFWKSALSLKILEVFKLTEKKRKFVGLGEVFHGLKREGFGREFWKCKWECLKCAANTALFSSPFKLPGKLQNDFVHSRLRFGLQVQLVRDCLQFAWTPVEDLLACFARDC